MHTIQEIISGRLERGLADLLLTVYDAGRADEAGEPHTSASANMHALLETIKERWYAENAILTPPERVGVGRVAPVWLSAYAERVATFGDNPLLDERQIGGAE